MTNEEFQRAMERIIKWQESFTEGMERTRALRESRAGQLEAAAINLHKTVAELNKAQKVLDVKMTRLAEVQARTRQRRNDIIEKGRGGQPDAPVD
jgi:hypothetical protein